MKCDHCGSDMIYDRFYGSQEQFWGWKCIFCRETLDRLILEKRKRQ